MTRYKTQTTRFAFKHLWRRAKKPLPRTALGMFVGAMSTAGAVAGPECLKVDDITSQTILTETLITFTLQAAGAADETRLFMEIGPACPQLAFHRYFHYIALDGELCAGRDQIQARSGEMCDIIALRTEPVILPDETKALSGRAPQDERNGPR